jgi:predicted DsbA family dithiol-disulfide isomerase
LDTDEPFKILQKALKELRKYGINGVPTFIIGEKLIFGAQPYEIFKQTINQILEEKSRKN